VRRTVTSIPGYNSGRVLARRSCSSVSETLSSIHFLPPSLYKTQHQSMLPFGAAYNLKHMIRSKNILRFILARTCNTNLRITAGTYSYTDSPLPIRKASSNSPRYSGCCGTETMCMGCCFRKSMPSLLQYPFALMIF